jgi:hypothetical protein
LYEGLVPKGRLVCPESCDSGLFASFYHRELVGQMQVDEKINSRLAVRAFTTGGIHSTDTGAGENFLNGRSDLDALGRSD